MVDTKKLYPRTGDKQTVYLKNVITDPAIAVGGYTIYNDFVNDPARSKKDNVLYHYPINRDRLIIRKFCPITYDVKLLFNSVNHTLSSSSTYPFPFFFEGWGLEKRNVAESWDSKGDVVLGDDVWIGYEAVIMAGIMIGDGAVIGARTVATKDVPPYAAAGDTPTEPIKKRYPGEAIAVLSELKWWNWPESRVAQNLRAIRAG